MTGLIFWDPRCAGFREDYWAADGAVQATMGADGPCLACITCGGRGLPPWTNHTDLTIQHLLDVKHQNGCALGVVTLALVQTYFPEILGR